MTKKNRFNDECPICITGRNSLEEGGGENCFHCDTCGFVECMFLDDPIKEQLKPIEKRLKKFYKNSKAKFKGKEKL